MYTMFQPEGKWGQLVRSMKNKRYPEASMLGQVADKEVAGLMSLFHEGPGGSTARSAVAAVFGEHDRLRCGALLIDGVPQSGAGAHHVLTPAQFACLHKMYVSLDTQFNALWERFVNEMAEQVKGRRQWSDQAASWSAERGWEFGAAQVLAMHTELAQWGGAAATGGGAQQSPDRDVGG